ncbi:hypothetical protein [Nonomuraea sp. NPDC002799]
MTDDKSRTRQRISMNDAGIERRRGAIEAIAGQAPPPKAEQNAGLRRSFDTGPAESERSRVLGS